MSDAGRSPRVARPRGPSRVSESRDSERARTVIGAPGVSARALAQEYGLEELRAYIRRSRREIDAMRGFPFARKVFG